jgi:hypothetical protein
LKASCFTILLIDPSNPPAGIPAGDAFETKFNPYGV